MFEFSFSPAIFISQFGEGSLQIPISSPKYVPTTDYSLNSLNIFSLPQKLLHILNSQHYDLPELLNPVVISSPIGFLVNLSQSPNNSFDLKLTAQLPNNSISPLKGWTNIYHVFFYPNEPHDRLLEAFLENGFFMSFMNPIVITALDEMVEADRLVDIFARHGDMYVTFNSVKYSIADSLNDAVHLYWHFIDQYRVLFGYPPRWKVLILIELNPNSSVETISQTFVYCEYCKHKTPQLSWKSCGGKILEITYCLQKFTKVVKVPVIFYVEDKAAKQGILITDESDGSSLDFQLFHTIMPNVSLSNHTEISLPGIFVQNSKAFYFVTSNPQLQFITCDGGYIEQRLSFWGFFSAFDLPTWLLFLLSQNILIFFVACQQTGKWEIKGIVWKYVFAATTVLRIIFYQGQEIASSRIKLPVQLWTMSLLVLSFFYVGDNISELTAPKRVVLYNKFEELLARNFTFFIQPIGYPSDEDIYMNKCLQTNTKNYCDFIENSKLIKTSGASIVQILDGNTTEAKVLSRVAKLTEVTQSTFEDSWLETVQKLTENNTCQQKAVLDWSSDMEPIMAELKTRTNKQNIISVSNEGFLQENRGWVFRNWGNQWLTDGFKALWWSGVYMHLKGISDYKRLLQTGKYPQERNCTNCENSQDNDGDNTGTTPVSISSNTVVIFIAYGIGNVICLLVFGTEAKVMLKGITIRFVSDVNLQLQIFIRAWETHTLVRGNTVSCRTNIVLRKHLSVLRSKWAKKRR